jgi:hypothetical protein
MENNSKNKQGVALHYGGVLYFATRSVLHETLVLSAFTQTFPISVLPRDTGEETLVLLLPLAQAPHHHRA